MNQKSINNVKSQNLSFMLDKPISQLVIKLAIPSIISMLILSVYSLVDIFSFQNWEPVQVQLLELFFPL